MNKILVIGLNPSNRPTHGNRHVKNSTFDRLHRWMDEIEVEHFSFMNVNDRRGRTTMKDVDFETISEVSYTYTRIVCLGGFVSRVLERMGIQHFRMPHPSPLNRQLNDKDYERKMIDECRRYVWTG